MMPGIISGFLLAFIVSLDDFIITNFVKGRRCRNPADRDLRIGQAGHQTQHHGDFDHAAGRVRPDGHDQLLRQQKSDNTK